MEKITFYNNSISLDEFQGDMDLSIFNSLLKYAEITLKSLGINPEGKQIYYQRYKNNTSMLAIKLNEDDFKPISDDEFDESLNNYKKKKKEDLLKKL